MSCPQTRGSCFQAVGPLILRPLDSAESHHQLSWFSSLQAADHGTSWPPQPHEPVPIINLFLYAYWSCFSGESYLMQPPIGFFIPCGPPSRTPSSWVPLLATWAAVTKHSKLGGLNIDICSLTVPEAGSPKSDRQQGRAPSKASRGGSFLASSVFGGTGLGGLWQHHCGLCPCLHRASSFRVWVSPSSRGILSLASLFSLLIRTQVILG